MSPKKTVAAIGVSLLAAGIWYKASRPVLAGSIPAPSPPEVTVAVVKAERRAMRQQLTLSSELVPFQQIDVYAKESGYVKQLYVDYGSHVTAGQVIATLEIPELQAQVQEDDAMVGSVAGQIKHAQDRLREVQAQQNVAHLEYERLYHVSKSWPGLLAQQEVDDAQAKDLAAAAQVGSSRANVAVAESELAAAQAKRARDRVLFDYSKITAPFSGVITKRYANLGTLVQAGTSSSTQVLAIVQLSQDDLFRLVIPVPESYVRDIRIGDAVKVFIPSLNQTFPGHVARFSRGCQRGDTYHAYRGRCPQSQWKPDAGPLRGSHAGAGQVRRRTRDPRSGCPSQRRSGECRRGRCRLLYSNP
jgi:RND family efflux transporter MFP subunit